MIASAMAGLLAAAAPGKAKLAVTSLASAGEVDPKVASAMTESVTAEVAARGYFDPISANEIATLLGVERQKQMLGCGEESSACVTEIAAALGAPYVMSGSLTRLEGIFQLNLQLIDTQRSRTIGRSTKISRDFEGLRSLIPYAVAEACGTPLPAPPSRVAPITLLVLGGTAMLVGGVLGIQALNGEAAVNGQLSTDDGKGPATLDRASSYRERLARSATERTISLSALLAGAALVAAGIVFMPGDAPQPGKLALLPSLGGVVLVGTMP